MKKCQVVLWLFVPAYKQPTKTVHPGMRPFHHPTARFEPGLPLDGPGLFSSWANMGGKAEFVEDVAHLVIVVTFVQTHPLQLLFGWLWTLDDDAFDGRAYQFHVMAVASPPRHAKSDPLPPCEEASFVATPAPGSAGLGGVFFPPKLAFVISPSLLNHSPSIPRGSSK